MEYTLNELNNISKAVNKFLNKTQNEELNIRLVYNLTKNMKLIQEEIELIKGQFKEYPEGYNEYITKLQEIAIQCGGEPDQSGVNIQTENFDGIKFKKQEKELNKDNTELIEKIKETEVQNKKISNEKLADLELYTLKLDWFPENIKFTEFPHHIIDLIED